jgi:hypothetical protein
MEFFRVFRAVLLLRDTIQVQSEADAMGSMFSHCGKLAALISVSLVAALYLHDAKAAECPPFTLPHIAVDIQRDDVREVFDVSLDQLIHSETVSHNRHHAALGFYSGKIGYKFDMDLALRAIDHGEYCALPKALHIKLFAIDRTIHFVQETRDNPCLVEHTRAHEFLHANADKDVVEAAAAHIVQQFGKKLATTSLVTASSYEEAQQELIRAVTEKMATELDAVHAVREQINRELDSTANLSEFRKACGEAADQP